MVFGERETCGRTKKSKEKLEKLRSKKRGEDASILSFEARGYSTPTKFASGDTLCNDCTPGIEHAEKTGKEGV